MSPHHQEPGPVAREGPSRVAGTVNRLGFALYPQLSAGPNLLFSPLSVYCALRLLYEGAEADTRDALSCLPGAPEPLRDPAPLLEELRGLSCLTDAEVLSLQEAAEIKRELEQRGEWDESFSSRLETASPDDLRMHLELCNGIWGQRGGGFRSTFIDSVRSMMPLDAVELDFGPNTRGIRQGINEWVTERTQGRIESMVGPGDLSPGSHSAVVGSVLHFRSRWEQPFFKSKPGVFYLVDGNRIRAQMMVGVFSELSYVELNELWAVEIPYARRPVSLLLIVPAQHGIAALRSVEAKLEQRWSEILNADHQLRDVILTLPETSVRGTHRLLSALAHLGLDPRRARFPRIGEGVDRVDEVLHSAVLSLDRYGTDASPSTVTTAFGRSALPERVVLTLDRPFLFAVTEKVSRVILYLGRIEHPD